MLAIVTQKGNNLNRNWASEWLRDFHWRSAPGSGNLSSMNTASEDFPNHLATLRERMQHPTGYERAIHYFLEEFAGDAKFMERSEPDAAPGLRTVLAHVASQAVGTPVKLDSCTLLLLREHRFFHGNARVAGRVVLFFYFQEADTGIMALIPGVKGQMEVARFRLTDGLPDPRKN